MVGAVLRVPVVQTPSWFRDVANAVNTLINGNPLPFVRLAAAPSDPENGQTYYDTVLLKVRTWNGSTWNNHW